MRILGLDVGDKTIGVAVSDEFGWTAQGIEVIKRKKITDDLKRLNEIIAEYNVEEIVVGLPKNMDGTLGSRAELTKEFGSVLSDETSLPIKYWDERLSTVSAERALLEADMSRTKRKKVIDKMAAVLILQGYLDMKG